MAGLTSDIIPAFAATMLDKNKKGNFWYNTTCPKCGSAEVVEREGEETKHGKTVPTKFMICEHCGHMEKLKVKRNEK